MQILERYGQLLADETVRTLGKIRQTNLSTVTHPHSQLGNWYNAFFSFSAVPNYASVRR